MNFMFFNELESHPVRDPDIHLLGVYLRRARLAVGITQAALARAANIPRLRVVRAERGFYALTLDEALRLARVLKVPLERLTTGQWRPGLDLRGIAVELNRFGIGDLEVSGAQVPGAFRPVEQVVAAALRGDRPEPRVIEAIPSILARHKLDAPLTVAFADLYDVRVRTRLAWLSDVTLTLSRLSEFPVEVVSEAHLAALIRAGRRPAEPDGLGHPGEGKRPRLWERWNITYAGDLSDFIRRTHEVTAAHERSEILSESEE